MKNKNKEKKGFTLIETLIAITILMISVAAPLSLAAKGLEVTRLAKKQIVAFYLAQDAFEGVKNIIQSNKLQGYSMSDDSILHNLTDCISNSCIIDTLSSSDLGSNIKKYNGEKLYKFYGSNNDFYGYQTYHSSWSGKESSYKRYFRIIDKTSNDRKGIDYDQIKLIVTVEWKMLALGTQTYKLEGIISNW